MAGDRFDDPRLTVMGLLIEVCQGLMARLDPVHAAHGLSGSDFDALIRLARSPGHRLRMTDLAAQTSMSTSGITRIVDRLENAGLVGRTRCRRIVAAALLCSPTPASSGSMRMCRASWTPSSAGLPAC